MGNNHPRYYNPKEAADIIGLNTWDRLTRQLNSFCGKYVDYGNFMKMISIQFDRMPKSLCECLYQGFAYDIHGKVEVKDFVSAFAAVHGQDQSVLTKFLFHVYSAPGSAELDRNRVERILILAYGPALDKKAAHAEVEHIFETGLSLAFISQKDFDAYKGSIKLLAGWVQAILTVFIEQPPPRLSSLERRYSAAQESEQMMARYGAPKSTCDQLRQVFYSHCPVNSSLKAELTMEVWMDWTSRFLPPSLARIIFESKLDKPLKTVWRFVDFGEFCMIYGMSNSLEAMASALCVAFQHNIMNIHKGSSKLSVSTSGEREDSISTTNMQLLLCLLSLPSASFDTVPVSTLEGGGGEKALREYRRHCNPVVERDLAAIEEVSRNVSAGPSLQPYVHAICQNYAVLPGLKLLSMTACCLFGLRPSLPSLENQYIAELMLWNQQGTDCSSRLPFGSVGSEWCIIASSWWIQWSYFVGKKDNVEDSPGMIDNWSILKRNSTAKPLHPGTVMGKDFEVVSPHVFDALQAWYGGGPKIVRRVVAPTVSPESIDTRPQLELFPPCLKICLCDDNGTTKEGNAQEMMFSRTATIAEVADELCRVRHMLDPAKIRLWNIEKKSWKHQYILSPELSLEKAGIRDGHALLLEIALADGTWPKSQLHSQLEIEENKKNGFKGISESDSSSSLASLANAADGGHGSALVLNNGRIGLDNLGNTCYMNASLQALLHTQFLVEYFLTKQHLREINVTNKFGYEGRVAMAFAKLVSDLWLSRQSELGGALAAVTGAMGVAVGSNAAAGTGPDSVSPKRFKREMGALRDQFAGDEQHDAQEFLSFLLDGLSEDLNLVHEKPYTEQPDSDGRPDKVLADIWWENHLKRELSVIQSIFTGQFKSITRCTKCEYNSARFEPFNMLSVPLPEDEKRSVVVHIVPIALAVSGGVIRCSVRVLKNGTIRDVANIVKTYDMDGITKDALFVAMEMSMGRVINVHSMLRKLDMVRESDSLYFFEVSALPRYRQLTVVPTKLPLHSAKNETKPTSQIPAQSSILGVSLPPVCSGATPHESTGPPAKRSAQSPTAGLRGNDKRGRKDGGSAEPSRERDVQEEKHAGNGKNGESARSGDVERSGGEDFEAEVTGGGFLASEMAPEDDVMNEVVFIHRRARFISTGGLELFKMEPTGTPIVEVFPASMRAADLYVAISRRVSHLLKSPISEMMKSVALCPATPSSISQKRSVLDQSHSQDDMDESNGASTSRIRPVATEDAIGGDVPPDGFVLRLVLPNADFCGRCHWLSRCEGCIIPYDDPEFVISLDDTVTIAIDWHFVVFQEVLDIRPLSVVIDHHTMDTHFQHQMKELPLDKCLQKFTEEEPLDDTICPKCHEDGVLRKKFALWRLPPVLIIQLKRFQFNSYSRRKLNNQVDFPLEGLDLSPYMAPTAVEQYLTDIHCPGHNGIDSADGTCGGEKSGDGDDGGVEDLVIPEERQEMEEQLKRNDGISPTVDAGKTIQESTCYDLYSSVHHVGALGGGHYIAAVRDDNGHIQRAVTTQSPLDDTSPLSPPSPGGATLGHQWWCYNDSVVVPVTKTSEIASPSAYVLFYIRRDVRNLHVHDIHESPGSEISEGESSSGDVQSLRVHTHNMDIRDNGMETQSSVSIESRDSSLKPDVYNGAYRSGDQCILS